MKKATIGFLLGFLFSWNAFSQKAEIGFLVGTFDIPNQRLYENPRLGLGINFSLQYYFHKNWSIGMSYSHAYNTYNRESVANTPMSLTIGSLPTEGYIYSHYFSYSLARKIPLNWKRAYFEVGGGFAFLVEENHYFDSFNFDNEEGIYRGIYRRVVRSIDWSVPLRVGIFIPVGNKGSIGFERGYFLTNDFFIKGFYFGPKLSIKI